MEGLQPRRSRGTEAGGGKQGAAGRCRAVTLGEEFGALVLGSGPMGKLVTPHWECRVLATGSPGKSPNEFLTLVFDSVSDSCGVERGKVLTRAEARAALSPGTLLMQPDAGPQGCFLLGNLVTVWFEGSDRIVLPI